MRTLTINGTGYNFPDVGDTSWGDSSTGVTGWAIAVTSGMLQKAGGAFALTADVDFGASKGLISSYFTSRTANAASAGAVRLANADVINWRNVANNANLSLGVNGSNQLTFNGSTFVTTTGTINASKAVATDGSGNIITSSVTSTELGYLSGVTSSVQTQISNHTGASSGVHGVTGAVVGTTDTQALTNKTIAAGSNTITGLGGSNFANQSAATFLAGPTSGSAAAPTFRALQAPTIQSFTSTGTTTGYLFTVTSANATVGATYTNNGHTYTVLGTISGGTSLYCSGALAPTSSGTLTKSGGTGDATITFSANVALATYTLPAGVLYLRVRAVGSGGGGSGSGTGGSSSNNGGTGGNTVFGTNLLVAGAGGAGAWGGAAGSGGTASLGTGPIGIAVQGSAGEGGGISSSTGGVPGGTGGSSALGGGGRGGGAGNSQAGSAGATNSGSGGGGGSGTTNVNSGSAGGSGGFIDAIITSPSSTYVYAVGTGGTAGSAATSGVNGGAGADGIIVVEEHYQ